MDHTVHDRRRVPHIPLQAVDALRRQPSELLMQAIIVPGNETAEGTLIEGVAIPWVELARLLREDPDALYRMDWRKFEELVAAAYHRAGYDEVILTPRSNDLGRDVIATKYGAGSIRIFDQVKKYAPGHLVKADEVRALLGVVTGAGNVSKGIVTTTGDFAPGIENDPYLKPVMPFRLELRPGAVLLPWLTQLASK